MKLRDLINLLVYDMNFNFSSFITLKQGEIVIFHNKIGKLALKYYENEVIKISYNFLNEEM